MMTSTTDLVLGNQSTSTGAGAFFDLSGGTAGTSTIYFGFATNTNVVIGGTSTTQTGLNNMFVMNGNDLFVQGNIGSVSSVYTNGAFVAGASSTHFGNGFIRKNDTGSLSIHAVSGTQVTNALEQLWNTNFNTSQLSRYTQSKASSFIIRGRYLYAVNNSNNFLRIFDISDPRVMRSVGSIPLGSTAVSIVDNGQYLIISTGSAGILVVDVSNPASPSIVKTHSQFGTGYLKLAGKNLYFVDGAFSIYDASNITVTTTFIGRYVTTTFDGYPEVVGKYAYVAMTGGVAAEELVVLDLSNPRAPIVSSEYQTPSVPDKIIVQGSRAYVSFNSEDLVRVFDVSVPTSTTLAASISGFPTGSPSQLRLAGRYLYVGDTTSISVVDIQSTSSPAIVGSIGSFSSLSNFIVSGRYLYASDSANPAGFYATYDLQGAELHSLSAHSLEAGSARVLSDLEVRGSAQVSEGLLVGLQGIASWGSLGVYATDTTSTFHGGISVARLTVNSQQVCLADGTNCAAGAGSDTLASVTARGASATTTVSLFGGLVSASTTVTSTLTIAAGSTGTPALTFIGDQNMGLYRSSTDTLGIVSSSTVVGLFAYTGVTIEPSMDEGGNGGSVTVRGGLGTSGAGDVSIIGGTRQAVGGVAGNVYITGGQFSSGSGSGGSVYLTPGQNAAGSEGMVVLRSPSGELQAPILAFSEGDSNGTDQILMHAPGELSQSFEFVLPGSYGASSSALLTDGTGLLSFIPVCLQSGINCSLQAAYDGNGNAAGRTVTTTASSTPILVRVPMNALDAGLGLAVIGTSSQRGVAMGRANINTETSFIGFGNTTNLLGASNTLAFYDHTNNAFAIKLFGQGGIANDQSTLTLSDLDRTGSSDSAAAGFDNQSSNSSTAVLMLRGGSNRIVQHVGSGSPEGAVYAALGSIYFNTAGSASGTQVYLKTTNNGSNGWQGIGTADMTRETLAQVTALGNSATATLSLYGGYVAASSTVTSTMTVLGYASFQNMGGLAASFTTVTTTGVTSTNLFSTYGSFVNVTSTIAFSTNGFFTNATATNFYTSNTLGFVNASGSFININNPDDLQNVSILDRGVDNVQQITISGRYAFLGNGASGIDILDISDPAHPTSVGFMDTPGNAGDALIVGRYAYVSDLGNGLAVIDISNVGSPTTVARNIDNGVALLYDLEVQGSYLYAASDGGLRVYDISNPAAPTSVGRVATTDDVLRLSVQGDYAYLADGAGGLYVIDITNPTHPTSTDVVTSAISDVEVIGRFAYGVEDSFLKIFDVSNPHNVTQISTTTIALGNTEIEIAGRYVYVTGNSNTSLSVLDVSNPQTPTSVTAFTTNGNAQGLTVSGRYAYLGLGSSGFQIVDLRGADISAANIGSLSTDQLTVHSNVSIGNALSVRGGLNVGLGGIMSDGAIAGPSLELNRMTYATSVHILDDFDQPSDMIVRGKYGYVADDNLVSVLDLTNPGVPTRIFSSSSGSGSQNTVAVSGNYLYAAGDRLRIFDISSPGQPANVAWLPTVGTRIVTSGRYMYSANTNVIKVLDLTDPGAPTSVASIPVSGAGGDIFVYGNRLYVSATNDTIIDISVPTNPRVIGTIPGTGAPSSFVVSGRYLYRQSGASASLEIYDVASSTNAFLVSTTPIPASGLGAAIVGNYLVLGQGSSVGIYDVSNPALPVQVQRVHGAFSTILDVEISGRYVYVTDINKLFTIDLGSADIVNASIGSLRSENINVTGNASVETDFSVGHGLSVGSGGITSMGGISAFVVSTSSALTVINNAASASGSAWGAYIDQLTVGPNFSATGTENYSMVLTYASSSSFGGLCIDDTTTNRTCPSTFVTGTSIMADGAIVANAFDLAEMYEISGTAEAGDLLIMDEAGIATVKKSVGTAYDSRVIGIVSTSPGFVLGWNGGVQVALTGRVPLKVSTMNGAIRVGDALTSSNLSGYAMKATKPGMIVGYALQDADTDGLIEVFVNVGYSAAAVLGTDGTVTSVSDDLVFVPRGVASSTAPAIDSFGLTFRGSAWETNSASAVQRDFVMLNDVISSTSSLFSIQNASGTSLFTLDLEGDASIEGDLQVGGRLFPSSRGLKQDQYYIFLDDQAPTGTYMATNADGWQSMDTYDFAERFYSPDELEPGDLVVVKNTGNHHVQRSTTEEEMLVGIVSTRPAFIAGRPATDTHPIALSGRVPTKVSASKGQIKAGEPLAPSTIPGVAVKATKTGPIIGLALEDYVGQDVGKIEVNVNPGWWTAPATPEQPIEQTVINQTIVQTDESRMRRGLARIEAGSKKVHVSFETINGYPFVQATPRGLLVGAWGTEGYSDIGFDIVLSEAQTFDAYFSWQVEPLQTGDRLYQSDGTYLDLDQMTGQPYGSAATSTQETPLESVLVESVTSSEAAVESPTTTEPLTTEEMSTTTVSSP
jgi:hypothetical protein